MPASQNTLDLLDAMTDGNQHVTLEYDEDEGEHVDAILGMDADLAALAALAQQHEHTMELRGLAFRFVDATDATDDGEGN